jgi:hypothetical protein
MEKRRWSPLEEALRLRLLLARWLRLPEVAGALDLGLGIDLDCTWI